MKQASHFDVHKGWKVLLTDIGLNTAEVLTLAGLPADLFVRQGARISPAQYFELWRATEELAGREDLPLKFGQAITVEAFDPPIFASLCSHNLNEALQRLALFKRLIGPMNLQLDFDDKKTSVIIECYGHQGDLPFSVGALELVFFTALARLGTRKKIVPLVLELPELPREMGPYQNFLGRQITVGSTTKIVFTSDDATYPFITENKPMWDFFEPGLKEQLSELEAETPVSQRVKSILLTLLPSGHSSIETAAGKLAMSPRTLQRHLAKESLNYQTILNGTRKELAQHYLNNSAISTGEISYLLGYQDSNSFLRAFKDWTGMTPGEFRQPHNRDGSFH